MLVWRHRVNTSDVYVLARESTWVVAMGQSYARDGEENRDEER
jgi:hypothetical protein